MSSTICELVPNTNNIVGMRRDLSAITPYCGFDVPTWLDHLRATDEEVFTKLKKDRGNIEAWDRDPLETWLKACHPDVYTTVRGMENAWKNCATTAFHQVVALLDVYDFAKDKRRDRESDHTPQTGHATPSEESEDAEKEEKPRYREKGEWGRHLYNDQMTLYRNGSQAATVLLSREYTTYYAVNGLWDMENLLGYFDRHDIMAVGVKNRGVPAEMEMLRYRVVTQEAYVPDHCDKTRKSRKRKV